MSFKDVRDLSEQLKLLGFSRVLPLQALATHHGSLANFYIVAEVIQWVSGLLEPGVILAGNVETEEQRVLLIRVATEFFVTKAAIKLNPRKLYAAAAVSCTELQKITSLLIAPTRIEEDVENRDEESEQDCSLKQADIGDKMDELRRARDLSSDLTQRGAGLFDLLSKELINKSGRVAQVQRAMELVSVERTLKNAIQASHLKLQSSRAQLENARVELNALNSKLLRKRAELERTKQRLEALQKIRPAHMSEFEECERELQQLFQRYFLRFHLRDALRNYLKARIKRRGSPISSPILQKPTESSMSFIPESLIKDDDDEDEDGVHMGNGLSREAAFGLDSEIPDIRDEDLMLQSTTADRGVHPGSVVGSSTAAPNKRPGTATSRKRPTTGCIRRAAATVSAATSSGARPTRIGRDGPSSNMLIRFGDNDSSFSSSDSDFNVGMGPGKGDDDFDLNSIDDISISKLTGELPLRPKTAIKPEHNSDEDF
ncbi:clusterin-associated protein 1 [Drosophila mojavensis]|uniref:clusterin-associated protein 1 n=1 Tax=Drosophila mojavensis TaxID=7230 RepID=UPI001CD0EA99|nr:clusterin-associated protein 1 [Drosophila mojavensis]